MITPHMILEYLSDYTVTIASQDASPQFTFLSTAIKQSLDGVNPEHTTDGEDERLQTNPSRRSTEDILYCGAPDTLLDDSGTIKYDNVVCVAPTGYLMDENLYKNHTVIICETDEPAIQVLVKLEQLFFEITSWVQEMRKALLAGGDYQSLLSCSEEIIGNFISISDSEFRLVAYTVNIPIDDPVSVNLLENGFHPESTVVLFKKYHTTKQWETQTNIQAQTSTKIAKYPTLDYVFRMHGNYFVHAVMTCNNRPISAGLVDTFQLLIDHIGYYVWKDWSENRQFEKEPSKTLSDMISRKPLEENVLSKKLEKLEMPRTGNFLLYVALLEGDDQERELLSYYARYLEGLFPLCFIGIHNNTIVLLDTNNRILTTQRTQLQSFLNLRACLIGVSNPFFDILDITFAYRQAREAVLIATAFPPKLLAHYREQPPHPLYHFSDCYAQYLLSESEKDHELIEYCIREGTLSKIAEFDRLHETNDLDVLFYYLSNECEATPACKKLHLHRNSLLYRISKMQERFRFDLEDFMTRQTLMLEYYLFPANKR